VRHYHNDHDSVRHVTLYLQDVRLGFGVFEENMLQYGPGSYRVAVVPSQRIVRPHGRSDKDGASPRRRVDRAA
jgi:hypothetical protein